MRIYFNTIVNDEYDNLAIDSIWIEPNKEAEFYMNIPSSNNSDASIGQYPKHWHPWNVETAFDYVKTKEGKYIPENEYNGNYSDVENYTRFDTYKEGKLIRTEYE